MVGTERVDVLDLDWGICVNQCLTVRFAGPDGEMVETGVICRLDTDREIAWYEAGGVMPYVSGRFTEDREARPTRHQISQRCEKSVRKP